MPRRRDPRDGLAVGTREAVEPGSPDGAVEHPDGESGARRVATDAFDRATGADADPRAG
jgi:hypothetical protein